MSRHAQARTLTLLAAVLYAAAAANAQPQLELAWEVPTPGVLPQAILPDSTGRPVLHVALKNGGLAILETAPQGTPRRIANIAKASLAGLDVMHLDQQDHLLYLALGDFFDPKGAKAGLAVIDIADPSQPRVVSIWQSDRSLHGAAAILVRDRYAYLGAMEHGVFVFDIADPAHPERVAAFLPDPDYPRPNPNRTQHPNARGFAIRDHHLFVAFDSGGIRAIDVADPTNPHEIGRYVNPRMGRKQQAYNNLVIEGDTAYVATDYAGMEVLDIRDPARIRQIAWWNPWDAHTLRNLWFNSPGHTNQIQLDSTRHAVYLAAGGSELQVVDVSDPARPTLAARYGEPGNKLGTWGVALSAGYVHLAYISALVPFQGTWSGIKTLSRTR
ncbi:MAG: hypothetical protein R2762_18910 [Bryobacteraceae bacterium]